MKLLRYNREPIEIDPSKVYTIEAENNLIRVYLIGGEYYTGYHLKG